MYPGCDRLDMAFFFFSIFFLSTEIKEGKTFFNWGRAAEISGVVYILVCSLFVFSVGFAVCGQGGLVAPQMAIGCVISRLQYWPNKGLVAYLYSKRRGGIHVHCWLLPGVVFSLSMAFSSPPLSDPHGDRYWRIFFSFPKRLWTRSDICFVCTR
jgi:hypothetical protein